jgi:Dr1-associated corepressor
MTEESSGAGSISSAVVVADATGGQWKSRFPVARIKKIMQADEDVGKVAQVTPVAICNTSPTPQYLQETDLFWFVAKALELFMDRIIKAVADETRARGARRVTPSHLYVPLLMGGEMSIGYERLLESIIGMERLRFGMGLICADTKRGAGTCHK